MFTRRRALLAALLGLGASVARAVDSPLMLAGTYRAGLHLPDYWISEKLDGVRARWDGRRLLSRGGHLITMPDGFSTGWPAVPLDGELWGGRGSFEQTASTVLRQTPDAQAWQSVRFWVFDLPAHPGPFEERLTALRALLGAQGENGESGESGPLGGKAPLPGLALVEQRRGTRAEALQAWLQAVTDAGGEGLMLHHRSATYRSGRSDDLLKLKRHDDAEAQVVGYEPGKGRLLGHVGALRVRTVDGRQFRLGSGLNDALRRNPPPLGTWVTYRHQGLTDKGLPRFARYLRIRVDAPLNEAPR